MHGAQGNKAVFERMFARCSRFMMSIQRVPQPVIAAVNGLATGAGACWQLGWLADGLPFHPYI
jgi:enoyl-CoA hydratase/carnithine racemase